MKHFKVITMIVIVIFLLSGCGSTSKSQKLINIKEKQVTIKNNNHEILMEKEDDKAETFVVLGSYIPKNNDYYDVNYMVLPIEKANELKQKYGDFFS